jgi:hypothetical protein
MDIRRWHFTTDGIAHVFEPDGSGPLCELAVARGEPVPYDGSVFPPCCRSCETRLLADAEEAYDQELDHGAA